MQPPPAVAAQRRLLRAGDPGCSAAAMPSERSSALPTVLLTSCFRFAAATAAAATRRTLAPAVTPRVLPLAGLAAWAAPLELRTATAWGAAFAAADPGLPAAFTAASACLPARCCWL